ncbi:MAG: hypothetical protein AAGN66_00800 [Acidobacteriota bacterium]
MVPNRDPNELSGSRGALPLRIHRDLGFLFWDLPEPFLEPVGTYLAHYRRAAAPGDEPPLVIDGLPAPEVANHPELLLSQGPLRVHAAGDLVTFELPHISAWCRAEQGLGGIDLRRGWRRDVDRFLTGVLPSLLGEMAQARRSYTLHAAAVAVEGRGILLPGPSGSGKSTIFERAHRAGLGALSDDSVWLHESGPHDPQFQRPGEPRIVAFPRGAPAKPAPAPTLDRAPLGAIVCPRIVDTEANLLEAISPQAALQVLVAQSGFLGRGAPGAQRFDALARAAAAVPCYALAAGRRRGEVPDILRRLP